MKYTNRFLIVISSFMVLVSASAGAMVLGQLIDVPSSAQVAEVTAPLINDVIDSEHMQERREKLAAFMRFAYLHGSMSVSGPVSGSWLMRRALGFSMDASVDADLHEQAVDSAREQMLRNLFVAQETRALSRERLLHGAGGK